MRFIITAFVFLAIFLVIKSQFVELTPEQYQNNQQVQNSLNFGRQVIIDDAVASDLVPAGDYPVSQINSVEERVADNGFDYRFDVFMTNQEFQAQIRGLFAVNYDAVTGEMRILTYEYDYSYLVEEGPSEEFEGGIEEGVGEEASEEELSGEWRGFENEEDVVEDIEIIPVDDDFGVLTIG